MNEDDVDNLVSRQYTMYVPTGPVTVREKHHSLESNTRSLYARNMAYNKASDAVDLHASKMGKRAVDRIVTEEYSVRNGKVAVTVKIEFFLV